MRAEDLNVQISESQQELGLSPVIAAAAHELKAPLLLMNFVSQILSDTTLNLSERQKQDYLLRLQHTSQRTLRLVQHLTLSYKLEDQSSFSFNLEPVNLREVCESAMHEISPYAKHQDQLLDLKMSRRPAIALANRDVTFDIVINLIDNAIKHNDPGTKICLRPSCLSDSVRLFVQNDGQQFIKRRELNSFKRRFGKVVQPFALQPGNSGLGLYIASQLAEAMGGKLGVSQYKSQQSFFVNLIRSQQLRFL